MPQNLDPKTVLIYRPHPVHALLQGRPLNSVHIIGWRKTKLSIKRKLFQPVQSGNSLRILGRFRYCGIFRVSNIPINREIPEFTHAFLMVAEFSGKFTLPWIGKFQPYTSAFKVCSYASGLSPVFLSFLSSTKKYNNPY